MKMGVSPRTSVVLLVKAMAVDSSEANIVLGATTKSDQTCLRFEVSNRDNGAQFFFFEASSDA